MPKSGFGVLACVAQLALCIALTEGCSDQGRRKQGETCEGNSDCGAGICGGGICLDPAKDEDGDSLLNGLEVKLGTNPVNADSDNDGQRDNDELDGISLLDLDGDGVPDVLESSVSDEDGDCLPDQYDPQNAVTNSDLTGLIPIVCRRAGVCGDAGAALAVACPGGPGSAACEYDGVPSFEADETACDGKDNDCDGLTDETSVDSDRDGAADCVDGDDDNDGVQDPGDNCGLVANTDQGDQDGDSIGDACDLPELPLVTRIAPGETGSIDPTLSGEADPNVLVQVFLGEDCTGTPAATIKANTSGGFSVAVPVSASATSGAPQRFRLDATNGVLTGACTRAPQTYLLDTTAPVAPVLGAFAPTSPSTSATPLASGTAEAGARVCWYTNDSCSGAGACGVADAAGAFATTLVLPGPGTYKLYAAAVDAAGNASTCSLIGPYVVEGAGLANPTAAVPPFDGPATGHAEAVVVYGCGDPSASVYVWNSATAACGQPGAGVLAPFVTASGDRTCATGALFAATVALSPDRLNAFQAQARSDGGTTSGCAYLGAYLHDSVPPAAPVLVGLAPASPSASRTVVATVHVEPGANVQAYLESCSGDPAATGIAPASGDLSLALTVPAESSSLIYAVATDAAGNASSCKFLGPYVHASTVPAAPLAHPTPFVPSSPTRVTTAPTVQACSANPVEVFANPGCVGAPLASLGAPTSDAACPGGSAVSGTATFAANTTSQVFGQSVSATGVRSGCGYLGTFVHDDLAPATPTGTLADAISAQLTARGTGTTSEAFARIRLYTNKTCGGAAPAAEAQADAAGAFTFAVPVAANTQSTLAAIAVDRAGNVSGCGLLGSYTHDTVPPAPPLANGGTASPSTSNAPTLLGCAERDTTLTFYADPACQIAPPPVTVGPLGQAPGVCEGTQDQTFALDLASPGGTTELYAIATDRAGNASTCGHFATYVQDNIPPKLGSVIYRATAWNAFPDGGAVTFQPRGRISEAGHLDILRVDPNFVVLDNGGCTGTVVGHGEADASGALTGSVKVPQDQEVSLALRFTDLAGNEGRCAPAQAVVGLATVTALDVDLTNPYAPQYFPAERRTIAFNLPDGDLYDAQTLPGVGPEGGVSTYVFEGCSASAGVSVDYPNQGQTQYFLDTVVTFPGGMFRLKPHINRDTNYGPVPEGNLLRVVFQGQPPGTSWEAYLSNCGRAWGSPGLDGPWSTSIDNRCYDAKRCVQGPPSDCSVWAYDYHSVVVAYDDTGSPVGVSNPGIITLRDDAVETYVDLPPFEATMDHTLLTATTSGTSTDLVGFDLHEILDFAGVREEINANSNDKTGSPAGAVIPGRDLVVDRLSLPLIDDGYRALIYKGVLLGLTSNTLNNDKPLLAQSLLVDTHAGKAPAVYNVDLATDFLPYVGPAASDTSIPDRPRFTRSMLDPSVTGTVGQLAFINYTASLFDAELQTTDYYIWTFVGPADYGEDVSLPELPAELAAFRPGPWLAANPTPDVSVAYIEATADTDYRALTELIDGYITSIFRDDLPRGERQAIDQLLGEDRARLTICCHGIK